MNWLIKKNYWTLFIINCVVVLLDLGSTFFALTRYPNHLEESMPGSALIFDIFGVGWLVFVVFGLVMVLLIPKIFAYLEWKMKGNLFPFYSFIFVTAARSIVVISNFVLIKSVSI